MKATLSLLLGHEIENSVNLTRPGIYVIGRHPEVALRVYDIRASKRHCMILVSPKQVRLRDFGSLNGTEVDGEVVTFKADRQEVTQSAEETVMGGSADHIMTVARPEAMLRDGSVIRLGTSQIQVAVDADANDAGGNDADTSGPSRELGPDALRVVGVEGKLTFITPEEVKASGDVATAFGRVYEGDITGISPTGMEMLVNGLTRRDYFKLVMRSSVLKGIMQAPLLGTPEQLRLPGIVKWTDFKQEDADVCRLGLEFSGVPPLTRGALMDLFA